MLEIMLRTLRLEAGGGPERMDPLLRELMVTALQRSQDERDRDNLTVPRYRYPSHHIQQQDIFIIVELHMSLID